MSDLDGVIRRNLRWNIVVHGVDAGFFGTAVGLASFVTILPLFVASMTHSALLVGLIAVVHPLGWHLPQVLTAAHVSRSRRYMPTILVTTIFERLPFFGLAIVAWQSPRIGPPLTLACVYALVAAVGLGGGMTATAFQSLVAKIAPPDLRGTFYGLKTASSTLCMGLGGLGAGLLLVRLGSPFGFTACFLLAGLAVLASYLCLALTREPETEAVNPGYDRQLFRARLWDIVRHDHALRAFVLARVLSQVAVMATAFFTVYAVRRFGMGPATAGLMTAVLAGSQTVASPLMGWLGDHFGHRRMMSFGMLAATAAAVLAWQATSLGWFLLVYALAGVAAVATWTVPLAMVLELGAPADRPAYIGLANTLFAPSIVLAPILGGWLADASGYSATFALAACGGLAAALLLTVHDQQQRRTAIPVLPLAAPSPRRAAPVARYPRSTAMTVRPSLITSVVCLMAASVALVGCLGVKGDVQAPTGEPASATERTPQTLTLYVGPEKVDCVGIAPEQCLQVKYASGEPYQPLRDPIEGFSFEPGYAYELVVQASPVPSPAADAPSMRYRLLEVVTKTAVTPTASAGAAQLEGITWSLVSLRDGAGLTVDVLPDAAITALFAEGRVGGTAGCNNYNAAYQVADDQITIEPAATTRKMCPEPVMAQEQAYLADLVSAASYTGQVGSLSLVNADGAIVATYSAALSAESVKGALTANAWIWTGTQYGNDTSVTPQPPGQYGLRFGEDGSLEVTADCNSLIGTYVASDGGIEIQLDASNAGDCGAGSVPDEFLRDLADAATYVVTDAGLVLNLKMDAGDMTFSRSD